MEDYNELLKNPYLKMSERNELWRKWLESLGIKVRPKEHTEHDDSEISVTFFIESSSISKK